MRDNWHPQRVAEATARQQLALHEHSNVWVAANAGTGKTHVLSGRILRLLVRDETLQPAEILAVTFTKAAAAQMQQRVQERMRRWAVATDEQLSQSLHELLNAPPTAAEKARARGLLARTLDCPSGVRVNTMHGFCQGILQAFPEEAEVPPGFTLLEDEEQQKLLQQALQQVEQARDTLPETAHTPWAVGFLYLKQAEITLQKAVADMLQQHQRLAALFRRYHNTPETLFAALAKALGVDENTTPDSITALPPLSPPPPEALPALRELVGIMLDGTGKTEREIGQVMADFFAQPTAASWAVYLGRLLTADITPRTNGLPAKKTAHAHPALAEALRTEQARLAALWQQYFAQSCYVRTRAFLSFAYGVLGVYSAAKKARGLLDYEDMIHAVHRLLTQSTMADWVRYRLDMRLKHVLLDEGQDTDATQWGVVRALTEEFFAGEGTSAAPRTLFAVGDMKQSVYRFRGAQPQVFRHIGSYLNTHAANGTAQVARVDMQMSFRSCTHILEFVDAVFDDAQRRTALLGSRSDEADAAGDGAVHHPGAQQQAHGLVTLWPQLGTGEEAAADMEARAAKPFWQLPSFTPPPTAPVDLMANKVAATIAELVATGTRISGERLQYGDIMILLRKRTKLNHFIAALDKHGIPHSGADTYTLAEQPVVHDVLALLNHLRHPHERFYRAQVLRSPLCALNDVAFDAAMQQPAAPLPEPLATQLAPFYAQIDAVPLAQLLPRLCRVTHMQALAAQVYAGGRVQVLQPAFDALYDEAEQVGNISVDAFVQQLQHSKRQVKQELEGSGNTVRLMTMHKAKGLEAPVVFLPDTAEPLEQGAKDTFLWQQTDDGEDTLLIWKNSKNEMFPAQQQWQHAENARLREDALRLLYVALTRAEERLYMGAYVNKKITEEQKEIDDRWYDVLYETFSRLPGVHTQEDGTLQYGGEPPEAAVCAAEAARAESEAHVQTTAAPLWLHTAPAAAMALPPQVRHEGTPNGIRDGMQDGARQSAAQKSGEVVHKLLEILPGVPPEKRAAQAAAYARVAAQGFAAPAQQTMVAQALAVLEAHPLIFGNIFGQAFGQGGEGNVLREVQLHHNGQLHRIDALLVEQCSTGEVVTIIDFKTDAQPPPHIPPAYQAQLQRYMAAVAAQWPQAHVRAGILWVAATNGGQLQFWDT